MLMWKSMSVKREFMCACSELPKLNVELCDYVNTQCGRGLSHFDSTAIFIHGTRELNSTLSKPYHSLYIKFTMSVRDTIFETKNDNENIAHLRVWEENMGRLILLYIHGSSSNHFLIQVYCVLPEKLHRLGKNPDQRCCCYSHRQNTLYRGGCSFWCYQDAEKTHADNSYRGNPNF